MKHRRLARVATLAALLPLAACTVQGDVFVDPGDTYRVYLTLSYAHSGSTWWDPCRQAESQAGLVSTRLDAAGRQRACRLVGRVDPGTFFDGQLTQFVLAASSEEHLFVRVPPLSQTGLDGDSAIRDLDVIVHLPGDVVAASEAGQPAGNSVHLSNAELFWAQGIAVTAEATPSEPGWLVPALAGLAWGAVLAAALLWIRHKDPDAAATPEKGEDARAAAGDPAPQPGPPANRPSSTAPAEDQRVWAPDA